LTTNLAIYSSGHSASEVFVGKYEYIGKTGIYEYFNYIWEKQSVRHECGISVVLASVTYMDLVFMTVLFYIYQGSVAFLTL
jgi:hypothetical protein